MNIRSVRHRGLRRFLEESDARGLKLSLVNRVRNVMAILISASDVDGIKGPPGWRIHQLVGDRSGIWSISVSGNWRITYEIDGDDIVNLDIEDYH